MCCFPSPCAVCAGGCLPTCSPNRSRAPDALQIAYLYTKARTEFGKSVRLFDDQTELCAPVTSAEMDVGSDLVVQNPSVFTHDVGPAW